jgi:hypothetical protein
MRSVFTGTFVVIALSTAVFGQQTPTSPASPATPQQPSAAAAQGSQAGQQVTVTGCVQREADYRRAQDAGRGGVGGTGVGAGNEFVLAAAMSGTAERAAAGAPTTGATPSATGTTGTSAMAYELTGPNEGKVAQFVGRRVEITGQLKPAEVSGAAPTGGPTAGAPPRGVDVVSKDLQLRELEITSVREASGTCAATPAK